MERRCTSEPNVDTSLQDACCGEARLDENEVGRELLTNEVSLVLEIQLDLFLSIFDGDESGGSFLWNSVEFWADASRRATWGSYRAIGGGVGQLGSPEWAHFL